MVTDRQTHKTTTFINDRVNVQTVCADGDYARLRNDRATKRNVNFLLSSNVQSICEATALHLNDSMIVSRDTTSFCDVRLV